MLHSGRQVGGVRVDQHVVGTGVEMLPHSVEDDGLVAAGNGGVEHPVIDGGDLLFAEAETQQVAVVR